MEVIGCKFAISGCKVQLLRKDMTLHEKDSGGAHTSCLLDALDALQIAQVRNRELEDQVQQIAHKQKLSKDFLEVLRTIKIRNLFSESLILN
jgi:hypothetical protein